MQHNTKTFLIHRQTQYFNYYFIIMVCSKIKVKYYQISFFKLTPFLKMLKFTTVQQLRHHLFTHLCYFLRSIFRFSSIIRSILFFPSPWLAFQLLAVHLNHAMVILLLYLSKLFLLTLFIFLLLLLPPFDCHLCQLNHLNLSPLRDDIHFIYQAVLRAIPEVFLHLKQFQSKGPYSFQLACIYQIEHPNLDLQIIPLPLKYQESSLDPLLNSIRVVLITMMAQEHTHFDFILNY